MPQKQGIQLNKYTPDYVVFDLETTGISRTFDEVVEISAVKVRSGHVVDEFSTHGQSWNGTFRQEPARSMALQIRWWLTVQAVFTGTARIFEFHRRIDSGGTQYCQLRYEIHLA